MTLRGTVGGSRNSDCIHGTQVYTGCHTHAHQVAGRPHWVPHLAGSVFIYGVAKFIMRGTRVLKHIATQS